MRDGPVVVLNKSKMFDQDASLTDIFGAQMTPGRGLVDEIIKAYKVQFPLDMEYLIYLKQYNIYIYIYTYELYKYKCIYIYVHVDQYPHM